MNSLLQQFFNISFVREGLLASPDNSNILLEESYLYQIKSIFASLKASDKKFHNPKDFTSIFKNYDNQVMNVAEQMDVDEFYNLLIDRLEPYLKCTKYENLFKYTFSGTISNEVICKGCPHYSETKEVFQSIIIQVKNKKNIEESLDAFIQCEMMEGENSYNCEKCEKKVSALKRQCIKILPKVLVLVLKRFEYDYDTMQKNKINDYCEFPLELNMEKYTQEFLREKNSQNLPNQNNENIEYTDNSIGGASVNLNPEIKIEENLNNNPCYTYDLTGVVIHTGTTERGHYYSFAKNEKGKWHEFNDTNVSPFNLEDLEDEAFGGTQYYFNNKTRKNELIEKSTNAYVLFYTRKDVIKAVDEIENKMEVEENKEETEDMKYINLLKYNSKFSNIQDNIIENIKTDNFQYWISKMIFSEEYNDFIKDILLNYNSSQSDLFNVPLLGRNDIHNLQILPFEKKEIKYENLANLQINKKNEKFIYENARIKRFNYCLKETNKNNFNISENKINIINLNEDPLSLIKRNNVPNKNLEEKNKNLNNNTNINNNNNNLEFNFENLMKKLINFYSMNSNIDKNLIISNIKRDKNATCLNSSKNLIETQTSDFYLLPDDENLQNTNENNLKIENLIVNQLSLESLIRTCQADKLRHELFKFGIIFFFTTLIRCKDKSLIPAFVDVIKTNINISHKNAAWLLEEFSNVELISEFLIDCPQMEMKRLTSGLIFTAIMKISINNNSLINENLKSGNSNEYFESVNNFISSILNLVSKKNKYPTRDFNYLFFILWRYSTIGIKEKEFLYKSGLVKFILVNLKLKNKLKCDYNLEECIYCNVRVPKHGELLSKKPIKNEKLTLFEELIEKKQQERNVGISDNYLLSILFEILAESNYIQLSLNIEKKDQNIIEINTQEVESGNTLNKIDKEISNRNIEKLINLTNEDYNMIKLEDKDSFRIFALESGKSRQGIIYLNNLINKFCFNNKEFSRKLFEMFMENFTLYDFDDLIHIMKPFRSFLSIMDDLADLRVINYFINKFYF